jgi:hypothetical protein
MRKMRNVYIILVIKDGGKKPFGRLQAYDKKKILKMDFWGGSLWISSVQVRDHWWDAANKGTTLPNL